MQTIVINSQKGGSGKTMLCKHLAVEAERAGDGVIAESVPNRTLSVRMPVYATLAKNPPGGRPHKSLFFLAPYKAVFPWPETN